MKIILYASSFFASLALLTAGVLVAPGIWMPFAVAILIGAIASICGWATARARSVLPLTLTGAMGLTVLITSPKQPHELHSLARDAIAAGFGLAVFVGASQLVAARAKAPAAVRRSIDFTLGVILMAAIVGYVSSDAGSASRLGLFFARLGIDGETSARIMAPVRKSAHFLWYGSVGWMAFRAALATNPKRAAFSGFATTLVFAGFDEFRQSMESSRTGSIWDVVLDLTGASVFVAIAWAKYRGSESQAA